jgi:hypothetical protein
MNHLNMINIVDGDKLEQYQSHWTSICIITNFCDLKFYSPFEILVFCLSDITTLSSDSILTSSLHVCVHAHTHN